MVKVYSEPDYVLEVECRNSKTYGPVFVCVDVKQGVELLPVFATESTAQEICDLADAKRQGFVNIAKVKYGSPIPRVR